MTAVQPPQGATPVSPAQRSAVDPSAAHPQAPIATPSDPHQHIRTVVDEADLLAHLRDFASPRQTGTEQARVAAELVRDKVAAIGGWDARVERLAPPDAPGGAPLFNVVADRRGSGPDGSRGLVVGGAHLDTVAGSAGANDDGSGVVALLEAAQALRDLPTQHDLRLVWFDGEEAGLLGSRAHVAANAADMKRTRAMVQAEMLASPHGKPVMLFGERTADAAGAAVTDVASRYGVELEVSKQRPVGSDHNPFDWAGVPAMVVATTAPPLSRILRQDPNYHSPRDTIDALDRRRLDQMADLVAGSLYEHANRT